MVQIQRTTPSGFNSREIQPQKNPATAPRAPDAVQSSPRDEGPVADAGSLNRLRNEMVVRQLNRDLAVVQRQVSQLQSQEEDLSRIENGLRQLAQSRQGENGLAELIDDSYLTASPPRIAAALNAIINERNELSQELAAVQNFLEQKIDQLTDIRAGNRPVNEVVVRNPARAEQTLDEIRQQMQADGGEALNSQANLTADNLQNLLG